MEAKSGGMIDEGTRADSSSCKFLLPCGFGLEKRQIKATQIVQLSSLFYNLCVKGSESIFSSCWRWDTGPHPCQASALLQGRTPNTQDITVWFPEHNTAAFGVRQRMNRGSSRI